MLSIRFVLSDTVATVSLSAPPTVAHIRRWAVNTVPAIGQTMQFGDIYLNDGHLPPEIPQIDGRNSFNSVSHRSLAVSFEVPNWSSRRLAVANAWIDASGAVVDFSCYVCVVASAAATSNDRAGVRLAAVAAWTATAVWAEMCGRRTRLPADTDPQEFLKSTDWCGRLAPKNSHKRTYADH